MAEVAISINGRNFSIFCEDGQEDRVLELGEYVDVRLRDISKAGAANNEAHLLVLTNLMLADEVFDLRDEVARMQNQIMGSADQAVNEEEVVEAINELAERIDEVSGRIKSA